MYRIDKRVRSLFLAVCAAVFLLAGPGGKAYASSLTLGDILSGADYSEYTKKLSGTYYVTSLYADADDTDLFGTGSRLHNFAQVLSNKNITAESVFANGGWQSVDLSSVSFFNVNTNGFFKDKGNSWSGHVKVYELNKPYTYQGVTLSSGTLLLALNDNGGGDRDFNDFIVVASTSNPSKTPIPAAAWLLGTGLIGILGITRRRGANR